MSVCPVHTDETLTNKTLDPHKPRTPLQQLHYEKLEIATNGRGLS